MHRDLIVFPCIKGGCQNQHKTCKKCQNCASEDTIEIPIGEPCPDDYPYPGSLIVNMNMTWVGMGVDYTTASGSPSAARLKPLFALLTGSSAKNPAPNAEL